MTVADMEKFNAANTFYRMSQGFTVTRPDLHNKVFEEPYVAPSSGARYRRNEIVMGVKEQRARFNRILVWVITIISGLIMGYYSCLLAIWSKDSLTSATLGWVVALSCILIHSVLSEKLNTSPYDITFKHRGKRY